MAKDEFASVLATYTAAKAEYNRLRQAEARATARGVPSRGVPAVSSRGSGSVEGLRRLLLISRRGPACFVVADELHPLQTVTVTISTRHVCTGCRSASCAHIRSYPLGSLALPSPRRLKCKRKWTIGGSALARSGGGGNRSTHRHPAAQHADSRASH